MDVAGVIERVEGIVGVRSNPVADGDRIQGALVAVREIQGWLAAQHAGLVGQLRGVESFPEQRIAAAAKASLGQAARSTERAGTLDAAPQLAGALGDGAITAEHVDAVTRVSRKLPVARRDEFIDRADALSAVAVAATAEEFARRLDIEASRLRHDDGMDRLERQRRDTRARSWVDTEGMWNLAARFDPITGVKIAARIDTVVQALFAESVPVECPDDPLDKQRYLAAMAVARLLIDDTVADTGGRSRAGRPEFVAVIDADAPGRGPCVEFSIPVEVPARVLAELAGDADVHAVVVRNGVVLYAPGELNLGRATRLANRAQRRALRSLYGTCAIPGCATVYHHCELHHIIWWRHQGRTDLDNLLPVCPRHHTNIHHDGWIIELGPNRELTLRLPDGAIHTTGPPRRHPPHTAA
jgi:hypothetical protein